MELLFPYLVLSGIALIVLGVLILLVAAFRTRIWWGIGVVVFPPVALVFFAKHYRRSLIPSVLMFFGVLMAVGPSIYTKLRPVDLGPRVSVVAGELHITLTGWDRKDYSVLRQQPSAVVVQMANHDVTDETLHELKGMNRLRELDLNGSRITDEGLKLLREELPNLESLKIRDTAVTDAGIVESVSRMDSLNRLDLRGTRVSSETVKSWRNAKSGRRVLQ